MRNQEMLCFNFNLAKNKPESIVNRHTACPFCDTEKLTNVIDREDPFIWLENKYPTLEDTYQTIIIETDHCQSELSEYKPSHIKDLFRFTFNKWFEMQNSGEYKSVILYKNHGPLSGGTVKHPHMQIVGLNKIDYRKKIRMEHLSGEKIDQVGKVSFIISNFPFVGFTELNVKLNAKYDINDIEQMAIYIQNSAHFLLNHMRCNSYNLFFYKIDEYIFVKIMPRFVTSPLFVGYSIPQISDHKNDIVKKMRKIYF
ncbi:DUF4931 domain-containing protein [Chengkuizengella marina]|uniref:DUF4931 domain-containing protein n=1 Tax=Chengkuizengella marina TaxID=2507566 RepID=A0A6N9Q8C1_9BACL|nr:DUF4931 domain-containing protein [Chengkuizengella marina]NBI31108.1 DUF4931 domain-containing protein [Chengkuizengella marina]